MKTALALLFMLVIAVACAPAQSATPTTNIDLPPPPPLPTDVPVEQTTANQEVLEVTMSAKDWEFSPTQIRAKQGQLVKINIKSEEGDHGIGIEGYDASVQFKEGEMKTLEFIADKTGSFAFYCNVPCGPGHKSMRGELIVE